MCAVVVVGVAGWDGGGGVGGDSGCLGLGF